MTNIKDLLLNRLAKILMYASIVKSVSIAMLLFNLSIKF